MPRPKREADSLVPAEERRIRRRVDREETNAPSLQLKDRFDRVVDFIVSEKPGVQPMQTFQVHRSNICDISPVLRNLLERINSDTYTWSAKPSIFLMVVEWSYKEKFQYEHLTIGKNLAPLLDLYFLAWDLRIVDLVNAAVVEMCNKSARDNIVMGATEINRIYRATNAGSKLRLLAVDQWASGLESQHMKWKDDQSLCKEFFFDLSKRLRSILEGLFPKLGHPEDKPGDYWVESIEAKTREFVDLT